MKNTTQPNQTETTADPLAPPALTFLEAVASADRAATVTKTPWYVVKADGSYHIGDADDLICYWPTCTPKYSTVTGALECCPDCGDPVDGACAACLEDSTVLAPMAESVEG